ncbi:MAG: HAD family hydrolase [Mycobacteriales bacterium]
MRTLIFDLGGVVLRWDPYAAFAGVAPRDEVDRFFTDVNWRDWNLQQDAGRSWDEAEALLAAEHPRWAHLAGTYRANYDLVIPGEIDGTGPLLAELAASGVRLLALTNWSGDLFRRTRPRFPVLQHFEGIVVSGDERLVKPDPVIFRLLCARYAVDPAEAIFVDDTEKNVIGAREFGLHAIHFTGASALRDELSRLGVAPSPARVGQRAGHIIRARRH